MKQTIIIGLILLLFSCSNKQKSEQSQQTDVGVASIAYTNFTLIDGSGSAPVSDAVMVVSNGRILAAGPKANTQVPDDAQVVDLHGQFVIPGLINAHGHVGEVKGIEGNHYSRENIIDNLNIYAQYGITTVVSLGGDKQEAGPLRAVNDTISTNRARLYIAGDVINDIATVDKNDKMGVDWMKIRVDDNLRNSPKMSEEVYTAVIKRSHELGYKIATHMYYLDDSKKLLAAGSDLMAHSVRDKPVDDEFITLIKQRNVCYCATLTRELSTFVYGETPSWFTDPFFTRIYDSATIAPLKDPAKQKQVRESKNAQTYKKQLPVAMANLKKLSDLGIPIAFGTDTGVPTRFFGYFEHIEMAMMAEAGMSPTNIIKSATKQAAECMNLKDVGSLQPGYRADFVVLEKNPLENILSTRTISGVWIGGHELDRSPRK